MKPLNFKQCFPLFIVLLWINPAYGQSSTNTGDTIGQMMLGLLAVIAMIFALVWLLKKAGYKGSHQNSHYIKIKASVSLSTKEKLILIKVGQQQFLIGVGPGFVNHIADIDEDLDEQIEKQIDQPDSILFVDKIRKILDKSK